MSPPRTRKKPTKDVDKDGRKLDLRPFLSPEEHDDFKARIKAAESDADKDKVRAERTKLRDERRAERKIIKEEIRELGLAWDQRLGDFVESFVDEDEGFAIIQSSTDLVLAGLKARTPAEQVVDQIIKAAAQKADAVFDFSRVPLIGWLLEMYDDWIFEQIAERWRLSLTTRVAKHLKHLPEG